MKFNLAASPGFIELSAVTGTNKPRLAGNAQMLTPSDSFTTAVQNCQTDMAECNKNNSTEYEIVEVIPYSPFEFYFILEDKEQSKHCDK